MLDNREERAEAAPAMSGEDKPLQAETFPPQPAQSFYVPDTVSDELRSSLSRATFEIIPSDPGRERFTVATSNTFAAEIGLRLDYQWATIPQEVAFRYLVPSAKIESKAPEITALALKLSGDSCELYPNILRTLDFLHANLQYDDQLAERISKGQSMTESALWVLQNGRATCGEYTNLFIALMRAQGVAARFVTGFSFPRTAHAWAEVYVPGLVQNWMPVDPQLNGKGAGIGVWATHIPLFAGADFEQIGKPIDDWGIRQVRLVECFTARDGQEQLVMQGLHIPPNAASVP